MISVLGALHAYLIPRESHRLSQSTDHSLQIQEGICQLAHGEPEQRPAFISLTYSNAVAILTEGSTLLTHSLWTREDRFRIYTAPQSPRGKEKTVSMGEKKRRGKGKTHMRWAGQDASKAQYLDKTWGTCELRWLRNFQSLMLTVLSKAPTTY